MESLRPSRRTSVRRRTEADPRASEPVCRRRPCTRRMFRSGRRVQAEPGRRVRPPTARPRSPRQLDRRFLRRLRARRLDEAARESSRALDGCRGPGASSLTAGRGRLRGAAGARREPAAAARRSLPPRVPCVSNWTAHTPLRARRRPRRVLGRRGPGPAAAAVRSDRSRWRRRRADPAWCRGARRPRGDRSPHLAQAGLWAAHSTLPRIARRLLRSGAGRSRRRHRHVVGWSARTTRSPLGGVCPGGHRARAAPGRTSAGTACTFRGRRSLRGASPRPWSSRVGASTRPRARRSVAHARLLAAAVRELRGSRWQARHLARAERGQGANAHQTGRRSRGSDSPRPGTRGGARAPRFGRRRPQHLAGERALARRASRAARRVAGVSRANRRVRAG